MKKTSLLITSSLLLLALALASCTTPAPAPTLAAKRRLPPAPPSNVLRLPLRTVNTNGTATLAWVYNVTNNPSVTGFKLYQGGATGLYTNAIPVPGNTNWQCVVSNLVKNTKYFFAVTAVAPGGLESVYSTETNYTYTVAPPLTNFIYTITPQFTTNLAAPTWAVFTNMPVVRLTNPPAPVMFLRLFITSTNF